MKVYPFLQVRSKAVQTFTVKVLIDVFELLLFLAGAYYLVTAFFSLRSQNKPSENEDKLSFAVLIPAHNEESVIGDLISSVKNTDYPKEKIGVFVIADGCDDKTASISKNLGACVIETEYRGSKGKALSELFEYVRGGGVRFDCIAVFDADNIVSPSFFGEINERLSRGEKIVQGYTDSKNPYDSWVSNAHSLWYWITNRVSLAGRDYLNLGARLCGTGFAFKTELLEEVPFDTESVAEDCEYTAKLALNNVKVSFCERAVVYDEKPITIRQSVLQRCRWTKGITSVQGEYTFKLLKKGKINAVLGLWSDFLSIAVFLVLALSKLLGVCGLWQTAFGEIALYIYLGMSVLCVVLALVKDKKLNGKVMLNIFGFLIFIISWIPVGVFGFFGSKDKWYHTSHGKRV